MGVGLKQEPQAHRNLGMVRILKYAFLTLLALVVAAVAYGAKGYVDAVTASGTLSDRADRLIAQGHSGAGLGPGRLDVLLMVQDPAFYDHSGLDLTTLGAGITTLSQSVSKRLAFEEFTPGLGKIRQTGYALGLERELEKDQIVALWLETVEMGRGPDGWVTGFFEASEAFFQRSPSDLSDAEFLRLVAVLIAPGTFDLRDADAELDARVGRLQRLVAGQCVPNGNSDVWLEGCG